MRTAKVALVENLIAPRGVQIQFDKDERTLSTFKRKQFDGPIPSQHSCSNIQGLEVEIIEVAEPSIVDREKWKASFWDASFNMSTHNKTQYLLEEDVSRLKNSKVSFLCKDAKCLLGRVTALVCLANVKATEDTLEEEKKLRQVIDL